MLGAVCVTGAILAHPGLDQQILDLTAMIEKEPENAELYVRRAEIHRLHSDPGAAETDLNKARQLAPDLPDIDLVMAWVKLDLQKPAEARTALDRLLQREPDSVRGLEARARALELLGEHGRAAEDLTHAIRVTHGEPKPEWYLDRGRALVAAGQLDRALQGLDEGLAKLGQPVTLQLLAIDIEQQKGRYDAALRRIDSIAAQSARQEPWLIRKGQILERAKRPADALAAYRSALAAIQQVPASRRQNRALQALESEAAAAVARLSSSAGAVPP
ncbi:MAG TPA: tetratricopeptide repeat protein [Candidatus Polarisedimenticolaceae bacterium]|nr:tetratricopeptide repeat protein [Candidatus Polarisedimenticolaceae bacterium]